MKDEECEICVGVVDDHEGTRLLLNAMWVEEGYRVFIAADGLEAIEVLMTDPPGFVNW